MPIKAVMFDWGDVYLNWKREFWKEIAGRLHIGIDSFEREIQNYWNGLNTGTIGEIEFWEVVGGRLKVEIPKESKKWLEELAANDFSVNEDVENVVKTLRDNGYKTALLSNTERITLEYGNRNGWTKYFNVVVASCDVGIMKPDLRIYKMGLKNLKKSPDECIFIDNDETYVKAAQTIGIKTILFDNRKDGVDYLERELVRLGIERLRIV